jgi:hypothetical protein
VETPTSQGTPSLGASPDEQTSGATTHNMCSCITNSIAAAFAMRLVIFILCRNLHLDT